MLQTLDALKRVCEHASASTSHLRPKPNRRDRCDQMDRNPRLGTSVDSRRAGRMFVETRTVSAVLCTGHGLGGGGGGGGLLGLAGGGGGGGTRGLVGGTLPDTAGGHDGGGAVGFLGVSLGGGGGFWRAAAVAGATGVEAFATGAASPKSERRAGAAVRVWLVEARVPPWAGLLEAASPAASPPKSQLLLENRTQLPVDASRPPPPPPPLLPDGEPNSSAMLCSMEFLTLSSPPFGEPAIWRARTPGESALSPFGGDGAWGITTAGG